MSTSSGDKGLSLQDRLSKFFATSKKAKPAKEQEKANPFLSPYLSHSSNVFAENKILRGLFVGILVVVIYNTYQIDNLKNTSVERIIPIGHSMEYSFVGNTGSDDYLRAMALFIVQMIGDLSAGSARSQFTILLTIWHPSTAADYRDRFKSLADEMEKFPSTSFDVVWDAAKPITFKEKEDAPGEGEIRVHVTKNKLIASKITEKPAVEYKIEYIMENGRFSILHIKEVGGQQ